MLRVSTLNLGSLGADLLNREVPLECTKDHNHFDLVLANSGKGVKDIRVLCFTEVRDCRLSFRRLLEYLRYA